MMHFSLARLALLIGVAHQIMSIDVKNRTVTTGITTKCSPGEHQIASAIKCAKTVTGSSKPEDLVKAFDNEENRNRLINCVFEDLGIVDDRGINIKNAEKAIDDMNTDNQTKAQLKSNLKECAEGRNMLKDSDAIMNCLAKKNEEACSKK